MESANHLFAVVDMGSNGIRFSISDLSPPTARNLPTIYQHRSSISLYDVQYAGTVKRPIPDDTIEAVRWEFLNFKSICEDFGVQNVRVLATEATREALNAAAFTRSLEVGTGWIIEVLSKEDESRYGALGIASSCFPYGKGLVIDLGGGSVQLSWLETQSGNVKSSASGCVSLPYGAAALTRRMRESDKDGGQTVPDLAKEIIDALVKAWSQIESSAPPDFFGDGLVLYLSGGGFRGWGHLLMSKKNPDQPYLINAVGGLHLRGLDFHSFIHSKPHQSSLLESPFRVSKRRAAQLPAVNLLAECLELALPDIGAVRFVQGGVREGATFDLLPQAVRAEDPLVSATRQYRPPSHTKLLALLQGAVPVAYPGTLISCLPAFVNVMYHHRSYSKDTVTSAALRSMTSGPWADVHGITHLQRAMLALLLCERWGGKLPAIDQALFVGMQQLIESPAAWWCRYIGRVAALIGDVYPSGAIPVQRIRLGGRFQQSGGDLKVILDVGWPQTHSYLASVYAEQLQGIAKIGKKKHCIGGRSGWGADVELATMPI
ncbi:MAG: hypothetical protein M1828_006930 [Chrysothrix sp. TS-e1954]|nr:MAG: hypothetical protein M1828_006930 [Chrysothrix sp. TS-e1954]